MTRAELSGAIKMLNVIGHKDRRGALRRLLEKEHPVKDAAAVLGTLDTYPEWEAGAALDAAPAAPEDPQVAPPRKIVKTKRGG